MSLPLLCSFVLQCPGFSGTVFRGSWRIWVPSAFFSRCMVWVILMHHLTAWLWYHSLNASQEHLLLLPPAPLGASVLLGSRLIWVPPHPLCASAFLSWLLWDSLCFIRDPASLGPSPYSVLYCPGFSGTAFCSIRVPASLGPSPTLVCFCFSVLFSLRQLLFC